MKSSIGLMDKEAFSEAVYDVVKHIPKGRATNYGSIAKAIGYPQLSRKVGKVLSECPQDENIPAHRVVNSRGMLSGRDGFETPDRMQQLLEEEGIGVSDNKIDNWEKVYWDPLKEIEV